MVTGTPSRIEISWLDGLRGTAALVVVLFHAFLFTGRTGDAAAAMPVWGAIVGQGYLGVPVFIVLSGYVLMLPVVRAGTGTFRHGTLDFLRRRARRILPPYFAALLFSIALIAFVPLLQTPSGTQWDGKIPVTLPAVLSHVFLVQDFSPEWIEKINGPMWSVAVEWQIYFLMPLVLLPLWRRLPRLLVVAGITAITLVPAFVGFGAYLHPWLVALFAMGMLAAELTLADRLPRWVSWFAVGAGLAAVAVFAASAVRGTDLLPLKEVVAGALVALLLAWGGRRELAGRPVRALQFFASKPMIYLGLISYSIYLFHSPLLALANMLMLPLGLPTAVEYLLMTFVAAPIAVGVAWCMFHLVERHFLNRRQSHVEASVRHEPNPAPVDGSPVTNP